MFDMGLTVTVKAKSKIGESSSTGNNLQLEILDNAKIYDEKICLGERIHKVLMDTNAKEESLSRQHKEAFDLYQRQRLQSNLTRLSSFTLGNNKHLNLSESRVIVKSFGLKVHVVTKGKLGFRTMYKA